MPQPPDGKAVAGGSWKERMWPYGDRGVARRRCAAESTALEEMRSVVSGIFKIGAECSFKIG